MSTLIYAQGEVDPTQSDAVFTETVTDSTISDSLQVTETDSVNTSSTAADSVAPPPPLYDFRTTPDFYLHGLYHDSTFIIGSRYVSFGDILDWIPGGYYYNLGGAGQVAYGSIFGAPPGEMVLEYDGLVLNNPLNGLADLNLIPTESMGHAGVVHSSNKNYGYMPIGQSLHFESRTIADNPIRSQVGYRTGYYQTDDVDVRIGIQASQKLRLDFGGVIRRYGGLLANEDYSGTKANAKIYRRLGSFWLLNYVVLHNQRNIEIPLPDSPLRLPDFDNPKKKERRTDHALILRHKDNFSTTLQYTKYDLTHRAFDRDVFKEESVARTLRSTTEYKRPILKSEWRSGLHAWATEAKSNYWGTRGDWQTDFYSSLSGNFLTRLHWFAGLKVEKHETFSAKILPEVNIFVNLDSTAAFSIWANQVAHYPSFVARYSTGPFAIADPRLKSATYNQLGLAGEKQFDTFFLHAGVTLQQRQNQIATFFDGDAVRYANMPKHSILTWDAVVDYNFLPKWRFVLKGNVFSDLRADPEVTQRPNFYFKTFLQYHLLAFQNDLNARLRLGAFVLGHRSAPQPFYADYSMETRTLKPTVYPYVHAVLLYGAAEIFFAYENFVDADVQYVSGYYMPQLWLRYGFIWHFVD